MRSYHFYSSIDYTGIWGRFKRDRSIRALPEGEIRSGHLVADAHSAAYVVAQRLARKLSGKAAEAIIRLDGSTSDGADIFVAEIWTRRRSRFAKRVRFAVRAEDN